MIIDLVLNRKDGKAYNPKEFYNEVSQYGEIGQEIAEAMDNGEEQDVKQALANYIIKQDYSKNIITYIIGQNWLTLN
jgi:hypothetical protein